MDKPKVTQKSPFVMEMEPGKKAWCSCGLSENGAFCDGSHKGTDFRPVIVDIEESKTIAWCGCKNSSNGAFCDGSHSKL